jgi:hypothetical protein
MAERRAQQPWLRFSNAPKGSVAVVAVVVAVVVAASLEEEELFKMRCANRSAPISTAACCIPSNNAPCVGLGSMEGGGEGGKAQSDPPNPSPFGCAWGCTLQEYTQLQKGKVRSHQHSTATECKRKVCWYYSGYYSRS